MNNSTHSPLVSICIPTFNGALFVREALFSAFNQDYKNIEIIISDDGSTDKTVDIIAEIIEQSPFPSYMYYHNPCGIGGNWNYCIEKSHGEYVKFLFQDDLLFSNCISRMMILAESDSKVGLIYGKRKILHDNKVLEQRLWVDKYGELHDKWSDFSVSEGILDGKLYLNDRRFFSFPGNKIGEPSAVLIKKECFRSVGYFNLELKQALDYEFYYRVFKRYKVGFVNENLIRLRLHDEQTTRKNSKNEIPDYDLLPELYLKNIFWYLHPKNKWFLLKKLILKIKWLSYLQKILKKKIFG